MAPPPKVVKQTPSLPSGIPTILTLFLLERASRSSHFSSNFFNSVDKRSTVASRVAMVSEWFEAQACSSVKVLSCLATSLFMSEIEAWMLWFKDDISPLMVVEISNMRVSSVAHNSDLMEFISERKLVIAVVALYSTARIHPFPVQAGGPHQVSPKRLRGLHRSHRSS